MKTFFSAAVVIAQILIGGGSLCYIFPESSKGIARRVSEICRVEANAAPEKPARPTEPPAAAPVGEVHIYQADISTGLIGINKNAPVDDPFDNVFHIYLAELPRQADRVWLSYELKGVQDHTAVARSINERQSVGGYIIQKNEDWREQQEYLDAAWLRKGDNIIHFALPENADYSYQVRKLTLCVEPSNPTLKTTDQDIVINQPAPNYYGDKAYIKGYLTGAGTDGVSLYIDRQPVDLVKGEFEYVLDRPRDMTGPWKSEVRAVFPDGRVLKKEVNFSLEQPGEVVRTIAEKGVYSERIFSPQLSETLTLSGAQITVPEGALPAQSLISITALRDVDIPPLNPDMVNVTKGHKAYRFLPHGTTFVRPANLQIGYDPALIPEGFSPDDVRTWYFNETSRTWVALPRDTVMETYALIGSKTTHFTDFINGIIKVPESPQTQGYTPTSIKDLKAADPSAGIVTIAPPAANTMGSANLSFPLKLPAGRQGMQPALAMQYNSEGGNGWMGLGWDLSIPYIGLETRWGAPRYDSTLETETYTMHGEQMWPVAHRGPLQSRTADKIFHLRVEGSFNRIIRHGNSPKDYWWEIVSKDGTRSFYGALAASGLDNSAVLRDELGNIGHWALREVRDRNDNLIRYNYTLVKDKGMKDGAVDGQQLYIAGIRYTGHGSTLGKYSVNFIRDRQLPNWQKRTDATINCRLGFKQVNADLLRQVKVYYMEQLIRSYELEYTEGAFHKTLLKSVTEKDKNNAAFYTHAFEYYDDVRQGNNYKPYKSLEPWQVAPDVGDESSVFGTNTSSSFGGGLVVTFGLAFGDFGSKSFTAGGGGTLSGSDSEGLVALVDITGDGKPDKVFKKQDKLYYRKNLSTSLVGTGMFGGMEPISGITKFSKSQSDGNTTILEFNPFPGYIGNHDSESTTYFTTYFADYNGDGLIDIACDGVVFFNHIENGNPVFSKLSTDTPSQIFDGAPLNQSVITIDPAAKENLIDKYPLHDVVRLWIAPFDGNIDISAPINIIDDPAAQQYSKEDGIRATIQHNGTELLRDSIPANDYTTKQLQINNRPVLKGDRLYFRLQSRFDGALDRVQWDPVITYNAVPVNEVDANNKTIYQYKASEDFIVAGPQRTVLFLDGKIHIDGNFTKPVTSDNITLEILKIETDGDTVPMYSKPYTWDSSPVNDPIVLSPAPTVLATEALIFRIVCPTNVDWPGLKWTPRVTYISADNGATVIAPNGDSLIVMCPVVDYTMFNYLVEKTPVWTPTVSGQVTVGPVLQIAPQNPPPSGTVTLSLKGVNEWYGATSFYVDAGVLPATLPAFITPLAVPANESLYLEYHVSNKSLAEAITLAQASVTLNGNTEAMQTGLFSPIDTFLYGPLYRGWGQFAYNGNRNRAYEPIHEDELTFDNAFLAQVNNYPNILDTSGLSNVVDPSKAKFILMFPDAKKGLWSGYDSQTFIKSGVMSSSRMGKDDITLSYTDFFGTGLNAFTKISASETNSTSGGVGGSSISTSSNTLWNILDAFDANGDRYPDGIGDSSIQYTTMLGGLEQNLVPYKLGSHFTTGESGGFTLGGTTVLSKSANAGATSGQGSFRISTSLGSMVDKLGNNSNDAQGTAISSIGISASGSFNDGTDQTEKTWLDVNGDGLPDIVYKDSVALNLGYRFAAFEKWGQGAIRKGDSNDDSFGFGLNYINLSWSFGYSKSNSSNKAIHAMQDVNGDGLVDELIIPDKDMMVRINTGVGFADPIPWDGPEGLDEGRSSSTSYNTASTYCLYVFPIFRVCFNGQLFAGGGSSRQISQISDIDGDGYPDVLRSEKDDNLTVNRSTIGRTNLLKKVIRPFNASFTLDYELRGNTYEMPNSRWVLTEVDIEDGLAGDGADHMRYAFDYQDGFHNRHEREFYGFKTVKADQLDTQNNGAVYRGTVFTFDNTSYYRKGLLLHTIVQDGMGNVFTDTRDSFELKDINNGAALPASFADLDHAAAFPALIQTRKLFYEGQTTPGLQTSMTYEYDALGNVKTYKDFGDGSPDDWVQADIQYHDNDPKYFKSMPASISVSIGAGIARHRETSINPFGNVVQVRQYLAGGAPAEFDLEYDNYGNLTKITRPLNHRNQRLFFDYTYDDQVQTYVTQVHDGYGYTSKSTYEYLFGQVLETMDMNQQKMVYAIDAKGRLSTITGPYEIAAGKPYTIAFDYHPDAPVPYAGTKHYDPETDGDIETFTFMDGLMRPVQVKKTGSLFTAAGQADSPVIIVSGRVVFDAFGRTTAGWYPITETTGSAATFNTAFDTVPETKTTYDILDRQRSTVLPDGATTMMQYGFGTPPGGGMAFKTTVTDALANEKEAYTDVRGRTRATKDNGPLGDIWTTYRYNGISELQDITDHGGNVIAYTYDNFGRKRSVSHPDAGTTGFEYDLAGNMTKKITEYIRTVIPAGGAILYTYDHERLIKIDYPKHFQNKVQFHYGDSSALFNRVGRIVLQEDASGGQEFFYGPLGEVIKNIRTVLINEANVQTFVSQYDYDTWNRIQAMYYPDGEKVEYFYNPAGKLQRMSGVKQGDSYTYVAQLGYDKFEQRVFLENGNNTETRYEYEPSRRRLSHLDTRNLAGRTFIDNDYAYDLVNNISGITNKAPVPSHLQLGGSSRYEFTYDNLYRLSGAKGVWTGTNRRDTFALSMTYDSLHNITRKNQLHLRDSMPQPETHYDNTYLYAGARPHTPGKVGGMLFTYDLNGNLTEQRGENYFDFQQMIWDEENRLMGVSNNGYLSRYTYDAGGERVLKSHGGIQGVFIDGAPAGVVNHRNNYTAYISPYLVAREHSFTKHYYVEGQRIASKTGTGKFYNQHWFNRGITAGGRNYTQRMQELQKAANAYYYGSLHIAPGPPTLPGYYAQPEITGAPIPQPGLDSAYIYAPAGWPQPPVGQAPGPAPGAPTLPYNSAVTNETVPAGYAFFGDGQFNFEGNQFFYHPDHLGSSSYITDINGTVRQHLEYLPFGETFVDEHSNSDVQPYLFNAKELDTETGLYYYGARYYDPKISMWASVDPLAEKYAGWSPYNYTLLNPVVMVDPDGRSAIKILQSTADFSVAFADKYTGGYATRINKLLGNNEVINTKSDVYHIGSAAGIFFNAALPSGKLKTAISMLGDFADGFEAVAAFKDGNIEKGISRSLQLLVKHVVKVASGKNGLNLDGVSKSLVTGFAKEGSKQFLNATLPEKGQPAKGTFTPDLPSSSTPNDRIEIGVPGQRLSRPISSRTGWDSEM